MPSSSGIMSVYAPLSLSMNRWILVTISNFAFLAEEKKKRKERGGRELKSNGENEISKLGKFGRKRVECSWVNQIKGRKG